MQDIRNTRGTSSKVFTALLISEQPQAQLLYPCTVKEVLLGTPTASPEQSPGLNTHPGPGCSRLTRSHVRRGLGQSAVLLVPTHPYRLFPQKLGSRGPEKGIVPLWCTTGARPALHSLPPSRGWGTCLHPQGLGSSAQALAVQLQSHRSILAQRIIKCLCDYIQHETMYSLFPHSCAS